MIHKKKVLIFSILLYSILLSSFVLAADRGIIVSLPPQPTVINIYNSTANASYAGLNNTAAVQALLNGTNIYLNGTYYYLWYNYSLVPGNSFNTSYAGLNNTAALQALLNGTNIYSTYNGSYAGLNNSQAIQGLINGTQTNGLWNISGGNIFPYDLSKNIGIGTFVPSLASANGIHINASSITNAKLKLESTGGNANGGILDIISKNGSGTTNEWLVGTGISTPSDNHFSIYSDNIGSDAISIQKNGNVGVGTTNPGSKLDVNGVVNIHGVDSTSLKMWGASYASFWLNTNSNGSFSLYDGGGSTLGNPVLGITQQNGNVGIGDVNPTYPMTVSKNVSNISIFSSSQISATGYITRTSIWDSKKGNALDFIKDSKEIINDDGTIKHSAMGVNVINMSIDRQNGTINVSRIEQKQNITQYNVTKQEIVKEYDSKLNLTIDKIVYINETIENITYYNKTVITEQPTFKKEYIEGVLLDDLIAKHEQAIYELKQIIDSQDTKIKKMEEALCKLGSVDYC